MGLGSPAGAVKLKKYFPTFLSVPHTYTDCVAWLKSLTCPWKRQFDP